MWTDCHCHLPTEHLDEVLERCQTAGVDRLVTIGTDVESSRRAIELAGMSPAVWATAGVHPHDASNGIDGLAPLLTAPRVVGVGECGLDYYYLHSSALEQQRVFAAQIELAHRFDLPLVIHTRDAWDDTFAVLESAGVPRRVVFHCFTGGPVELDRCLAIGAWVSFSGIVTFPNAPEVQQAASIVPLDRLVVETDSPYLSPVPFRGKRNDPSRVAVVGEFIAARRGIDPPELAALTSANADLLFGLVPR